MLGDVIERDINFKKHSNQHIEIKRMRAKVKINTNWILVRPT